MDYLDTWSKDRTHETADDGFELGMQAFAASPVGSISGLDPTKLALCTDVSHWQGDIDFAKLKAGRVSLVFPKASDGKQVRPGGAFEITNYIDDKLYQNVQGCYDNKIACAPYHYVQPYFANYTVTGIIDANWNPLKAAFDKLVPGVSYHAIVLDVEEKGGSEPNRSDVVMGLIKRIREDAKMSKVPLILYSSNYILNTYYPGLMNQVSYQGSKVVDGLWMAQWVYNTTTTTTWEALWSTYMPAINFKVITPGYASWTFVQWSSSFILPGCAGRMDVNAYKASEAHLYEWLGFAAAEPPPPDPDPDPQPEITRAEFDALSARVTATEADLQTLIAWAKKFPGAL